MSKSRAIAIEVCLIVVAIAAVVFVAVALKPNANTQSVNAVAATAIATSTPTSTNTPAQTPKISTVSMSILGAPTPRVTKYYSLASTPLAVDGLFVQPALQPSGDVSLRRAATLPQLPVETVLAMLQDQGIRFAKGGIIDGQKVTLSAMYGLVTVGKQGDAAGMLPKDATPLPDACKGWLGMCDVVLEHCVNNRAQCSDVKIVGRYENRPGWVIDYTNIISHGTMMCPEGVVTCDSPTNDHAVVVFDEGLQTWVESYSYNSAHP